MNSLSDNFTVFNELLETYCQFCQFSPDQKQQFLTDSMMSVIAGFIGKSSHLLPVGTHEAIKNSAQASPESFLQTLTRTLKQLQPNEELLQIVSRELKDYSMYLMQQTDSHMTNEQKVNLQNLLTRLQ